MDFHRDEARDNKIRQCTLLMVQRAREEQDSLRVHRGDYVEGLTDTNDTTFVVDPEELLNEIHR